jgi:Leucine-rich repeat (LRR) protein
LNQIATLDLSNNPNLIKLYCGSNQLNSLDVSQNPQLEELYCYTNQLTELNLDNNPNLNKVWCFSNHLTELHVQNGANGLLSGTYNSGNDTYARFRATGNAELTCIYVDDAMSAKAGIGDYQDWEIDATANFVETVSECQALGVDSANFRNQIKIYPNPVKDLLLIQFGNNKEYEVKFYNFSGQKLLEQTAQSNLLQIDMSRFKSGNYLVQITTGSQILYDHIIKE